jgi:hypothetical protein
MTGRRSALPLLCVGIAISACTDSAAPGHAVAAPHVVVVPDVIGMSPGAATHRLSVADLSPQVLSSDASASGGGTVTGSDPSAGVSVPTGAPVSLAVADRGATPPSTPVDPSTCASGRVAYRPSAETGSICLRVGSTLTVTFTSGGGWSGYGQWSRWPPTITDSSTLRGLSWMSSGRTATALFRASDVGTATVTATFDVTCAPGDETPCTVPPGEFHDLTVTVVTG